MKSINRKSCRIPEIILTISIIFQNPFIACTNLNSPFYHQVLSDFDTSSYFIALDVKSPYYNGRTIIENNNLYLFLHKAKGFDKESYKHYMERLLTHNRALRIDNKDFNAWKFMKVYESESVVQIANRGSDNFVSHYFNGRVLNSGLTEKEQNAVINQLFYWEIPARIDKQTGDLIIG